MLAPTHPPGERARARPDGIDLGGARVHATIGVYQRMAAHSASIFNGVVAASEGNACFSLIRLVNDLREHEREKEIIMQKRDFLPLRI